MSKQMADQAAKVNLVGIYLMPEGDWVVEDGSKAGVNKYLCSSKADVLAKIAEFLDQMAEQDLIAPAGRLATNGRGRAESTTERQ